MSQNINEEVFKEKRKPKGEIKFKLSLNEEQKEAKQIILDNPVVLVRGMAGSGKTLLACQIALDLVFKKEMEKIIITRPTVSKEEIGFLPGDLKEKMDPWLAPIYANLYMLYDKDKIDKMVLENQIEIVPFAFMRGRTFPNSIVIVDECQNITHSQTEMMLGRLGKGGKMIFCGDLSQVDLKSKKDSGISFFIRLEERIKGVRIITLKKNHRHEIVEEILKTYDEFRDVQ
jgi:phosphate starvation-inducible PhoH-like protein